MADSDKAIQLNKADMLAHVTRGNVWMSRNDHRRAHAEFDEAISLAPTNAYAWSFRSACWQLENNYEEAIKVLTEAIRLYPNNNAFLVGRADLWVRTEENVNVKQFVGPFPRSLSRPPQPGRTVCADAS